MSVSEKPRVWMVLMKGDAVREIDVRDWIGKPVMDQPGGTREVGVIRQAGVDHFKLELRAEVELTDEEFAFALLTEGDRFSIGSKPIFGLPGDEEPYDSERDTREHIAHVAMFIGMVVGNLQARAALHDRSKLEEPEKAIFDEFTPKLRAMTYDVEADSEYQQALKGMGAGLDHHYEHNDHHPEHFRGGIGDMDLMQITEMLCDWKAATLRHEDGDLRRSIEQNQERFTFDDGIKYLLLNTAERMGWL